MTDTKYIVEGGETPDPSFLAHILLDIEAEIAKLRLRKEVVTEALADIMPAKRMELPGLPPFERMKKADRKNWQTPELLNRMVVKAKTEKHVTEDGEIVPPEEVLSGFIEQCAHIDYWRIKPLEQEGFQVDEYVETTRGGFTIRFYGEAAK